MRDALPYLTPAPHHFDLGPWRMEDGTEVPEHLEGWDSGSDQRLERSVKVDVDAVRAESLLTADRAIRVTASWFASDSQMRGRAGSVVLTGSGEHRLVAILPGAFIGGRVDLRTTVTGGRMEHAAPGVARFAGSLLHEDTLRVGVQDEGAMFPIEVVDFSHTPWDSDASWHLTLRDDLELSFMGGCWLSLNLRDKELIAAVSATKKTPRQVALLRSMYGEVCELLVEIAEVAAAESGLHEREWPSESLGEVLVRFVAGRVVSPDHGVGLMEVATRRTRRQGIARRFGVGRMFS